MTKSNKTEYKKQLTVIKIGFMRQDSSLTSFCESNGIDRRHFYRVLKGTWTGEKADQLKKRVIDASKGKASQK
jgi:hypothetical protein